MSATPPLPPKTGGRDRSLYMENPDGFDVTDGEYFKQHGERKLIGRVQRMPGGGGYRAWRFTNGPKGFVCVYLCGDFQTAVSKIELCQPTTSKPRQKKKRQPRTRKSVQPNRG